MLPKPSDGFEWVQAGGGAALVCRALESCAPHLLTTRGWQLSSPGNNGSQGWADVARALHVDPAGLVRAHQVHGTGVLVRRRGDPHDDRSLPEADIIVSNDPTLVLAVQTADCVPLLLADRATGAAAAAHAGWRGLAAGVPLRAVRALADAFGSRPEHLIAVIGPSISADRYEVDAVVRDEFAASHSDDDCRRWFLSGRRPAHWQFDGWTAARDQLRAAGVAAEDIYCASLCTATHSELCSYRRDGQAAGRMAAAIRPCSRPGNAMS